MAPRWPWLASNELYHRRPTPTDESAPIDFSLRSIAGRFAHGVVQHARAAAQSLVVVSLSDSVLPSYVALLEATF